MRALEWTHLAELTLFLISEDQFTRMDLKRILCAKGWRVESFPSVEDFLSICEPSIPGCLIAEFEMEGMNGLDLQDHLAIRGDRRPVIFLSRDANIPSCVKAIQAGAVDFLTDPVDPDVLVRAIRLASQLDMAQRIAIRRAQELAQRIATLTYREREVIHQVAAGLLNKQIANGLGIVEKTVKVHRARALAKLGVRSTAQLVRLVVENGQLLPA